MQPKEKTRDDGLADDWHLRNDQVIDANLGEDQALARALNAWLSTSETALLNYDRDYADADTLFTQEVAAADQRHDDKLAVANKQFDKDATAAGLKYYNAVAGLRAALGVSYTPAQWEAFKAAEKVHRDNLADDLKNARLARASAIGGAKVDRAGEIGDANATRAADYGDAVRTLAASLNGADVKLQQDDEAAGNAWASEVGAAEKDYTSHAQQRHVTYAQAVYSAGQGQTSIYVTWVKDRTAAEVDLAEDIAQASSDRQIAVAEAQKDFLTNLPVPPAQGLADATRAHGFLVASQSNYLAFVRATAQAAANEAIAGAEATAARRVTQAGDQQTYANEVAAAKEKWLKDTVAAQEAADVLDEQYYADRRTGFAELTAARLVAQAGVYETYDRAVQAAERDFQVAFINGSLTASSDRLDNLDQALFDKVEGMANIDVAWMSGGLAAAPTGGPVGQPRSGPSGGALPGAAAVIHTYADNTALNAQGLAYELAWIQQTYEKAEHLAAKNRTVADNASLKTYDDALAAAVEQRYVAEGAALGDWHRQSAAHTASATTTAYTSLGTPYVQHVIALANAEAGIAATEEAFIDSYYAALGLEQKQALNAIAAERQTRGDAIADDRHAQQDAVSAADKKLAEDLADHELNYTTGIAPAREMYRDTLADKRRDGRIAGIQAAIDNQQTFWHGGNYGLPPQPAKNPPTPSKAPAVAQPKPAEQIVYGIAEAALLGIWSVNDATAVKTHVTTTENAYVTYVTNSGEERRLLSRKVADEQKQLAIDVATTTANYLNAAAGRVVTALTTFVTTHPSDWANAALSTAQANAAQVATTTAATLTDATNQANAKHGEALQRADDRKQKAIDRATADKDAAIRVANQAIFEAIGEAAKDTALALLGLYDIVDLPWEPRPGDDLPTAPFTLPDDIIDYAPRFVDTWFASVGTPEAVMVLSLAGTGAGSGGLPYSLIGSGAMYLRSTDDGGSGGIGPNGTNRTVARTSAGRRSGDSLSQGFFNVTDESYAQQTDDSAKVRLKYASQQEVTETDRYGVPGGKIGPARPEQTAADAAASQPQPTQPTGPYQQYPGGPVIVPEDAPAVTADEAVVVVVVIVVDDGLDESDANWEEQLFELSHPSWLDPPTSSNDAYERERALFASGLPWQVIASSPEDYRRRLLPEFVPYRYGGDSHALLGTEWEAFKQAHGLAGIEGNATDATYFIFEINGRKYVLEQTLVGAMSVFDAPNSISDGALLSAHEMPHELAHARAGQFWWELTPFSSLYGDSDEKRRVRQNLLDAGYSAAEADEIMLKALAGNEVGFAHVFGNEDIIDGHRYGRVEKALGELNFALNVLPAAKLLTSVGRRMATAMVVRAEGRFIARGGFSFLPYLHKVPQNPAGPLAETLFYEAATDPRFLEIAGVTEQTLLSELAKAEFRYANIFQGGWAGRVPLDGGELLSNLVDEGGFRRRRRGGCVRR